MAEVVDNAAMNRFELTEQGLTAFADYRRQGEVMVILHVEAPIPLRGKGTAGRLMDGMLQRIKDEGLKVRPLCGYASAYLRRNPRYLDLVA